MKKLHPRSLSFVGALDVLLPAFAASMLVAIAVSVLDRKGQARLEGVEGDFEYSKQKHG